MDRIPVVELTLGIPAHTHTHTPIRRAYLENNLFVHPTL